jgi:antitoxin (DNA-binding transcriptional repressor) of toxin-antitoxin stability system
MVSVESGEEVIVCKGQQPVARLVPYRPPRNQRPTVGTRTSKPVRHTPDCFEPLTDRELEELGFG